MYLDLETSDLDLFFSHEVFCRIYYYLHVPLVIGHRGSPEFVPEHSIASYAIAIREGVDYIEPDLGITKDGRYICMHDPDLGVTTDIADHPEFANRSRTITFTTGQTVTGWIVSDFTLAEIKTLRLKQRVAIRDQIYNGLFQVPTIEDALEALQARNAALNVSVGIYIEPKHPTFFASQGLNFDELVPILERFQYVMKGPEAKKTKVFLESFESTHLQRLKNQTDVRLIMLVTNPDELQEDTLKPFGELFTSSGLDMLSKLVDGIGPNKQWLLTSLDKAYAAKAQATNSFMGASLVQEAHRRNLRLHPWTVRNRTEDAIVDQYFQGDMMKVYDYLFDIGVDGIFTENAGYAVASRNNFVKRYLNNEGVSVGGAIAIAFVMAVTFFVFGAFSFRLWSMRRNAYGKV